MIATEYVLQRTSRATPFLRQVELFSGVSIRSQAINDDRTIQRIADGIRNLQGFTEEDSEDFRKDGKQICLTSIDFDSDELRIVERQSVCVLRVCVCVCARAHIPPIKGNKIIITIVS